MTRAPTRLYVASLVCALSAAWPLAGRASASHALSGRWLMAQLTTTAAHAPILGEIYATSRLVAVHELRHEQDRLYGPGQLCALKLHSGSRFVRTTLPEAFKARLPPPVLDARLSADAEGRVTLRQDKQSVVVGARLRDPLRDPLPHQASDPRVFDEDRDGHPGVTIEIGGIVSGRIYVAQRSWTELSGRMTTRDGFSGSLRFGNEQVVLEATSSLLRRAPKARALPAQSWFRMMRLPDHTSCKEAESLAAGWFQ